MFSSGASAPTQPLDRRDADAISQDIKSINDHITALTQVTDNYNGGLLKALPLNQAESSLESSIKIASSTSQNLNQLDSAESETIIAYINDTLEPNIHSVLAALSAKRAQITKSMLAGKVKGDIATLHKMTLDLGKRLVEKASDDQKEAGMQVLAKIDAAFINATTAWNSGK